MNDEEGKSMMSDGERKRGVATGREKERKRVCNEHMKKSWRMCNEVGRRVEEKEKE